MGWPAKNEHAPKVPLDICPRIFLFMTTTQAGTGFGHARETETKILLLLQAVNIGAPPAKAMARDTNHQSYDAP